MKRRAMAALLAIVLCAGCAVNRSIYIPFESKVFPPRALLDPVFIGMNPAGPMKKWEPSLLMGNPLKGMTV